MTVPSNSQPHLNSTSFSTSSSTSPLSTAVCCVVSFACFPLLVLVVFLSSCQIEYLHFRPNDRHIHRPTIFSSIPLLHLCMPPGPQATQPVSITFLSALTLTSWVIFRSAVLTAAAVHNNIPHAPLNHHSANPWILETTRLETPSPPGRGDTTHSPNSLLSDVHVRRDSCNSFIKINRRRH